jgi:hypothetical protein
MNIQLFFQEMAELYDDSVCAISDIISFNKWVGLENLSLDDDYDDYARYCEFAIEKFDETIYERIDPLLGIYHSIENVIFLMFFSYGEVCFCLNEKGGQLFVFDRSGAGASSNPFDPTEAMVQTFDCEINDTNKVIEFSEQVVVFNPASKELCISKTLHQRKQSYKIAIITKVDGKDTFGIILMPVS